MPGPEPTRGAARTWPLSLLAHASVNTDLGEVFRPGRFAVRTPQRRLHQSRLHQLEAVEERGYLVQRAQHERGAGVLVPRSRPAFGAGRVEVSRPVRQGEETAGRERVAQCGDDTGRVLLVLDEVQNGDQQQGNRLGEVDQPPQFRMRQDYRSEEYTSELQ